MILNVLGVVVGSAVVFAGGMAWWKMRREAGSLKPAIVGMVFVLGGGMLIFEGLGLV